MSSRILLVALVVLLAITLFFVFTQDAAAQKDTKELKGTDKKLVGKRGVNESLANRELGGEKNTGPTKAQMMLGIGSCFVMYAVVKWL